MKKPLLTLLLPFCLLTFLLAQKKDVTIGEKFKNPFDTYPIKLLESDETGSYVLKKENEDQYRFHIDHFDKDLNRTQSVELKMFSENIKRKDQEFQDVININGILYAFSTAFDRNKNNGLFVQSFNKQTLKLNIIKYAKSISNISFSGMFLHHHICPRKIQAS